MALGEVANRPENQCPGSRPETERNCNIQRCTSYDYERQQQQQQNKHQATLRLLPSSSDSGNGRQPEIRAKERQNFVQDPSERTVKLRVGGRATIYEGTKVKIRCPVKKFDR